MAVTFELPTEMEQRLRAETPNLDAEAKEAMLVELYRQEKLAHFELSQALGLDRFETDAVLKRRQVAVDLPTATEIEDGLQGLRNLVNQ